MHAAHGGQMLLSPTTYALVKDELPEGVSLISLGEHGLREFPRPQPLFQVVISELPADFPPPRTIEHRFQNLPAHLTTLIGREREITAVCDLLQREEVRLLTLTGTGGIGKTRLGIAVAASVLDTFPDGVAFVPLAPVVHPGLVLLTIKQTLGLMYPERSQNIEHAEDLKAFLQDRHMLLVLDNFEQVLPAASYLTDILLACPHLKVLVTSRAVLRVQGEYEFAVPPLALPQWTHLPAIEVLTQYESVALFVERTQAINPGLPLTKANMQAIAAICVHLEGLPLALELAAARTKLLPPAALLRQLTQTQRLDVLTGGIRDVPERQQTLRNTLAWSYHLLNQLEQQLFRLLSIFVGGCTLDAITAVSTAVVGESLPLLDILASLIDKSLLYQTEQEGDEARFAMLETVREYGLDCLHHSHEEEVAWQALATYYLALAEQAEPQYAGSEQVIWLQRLEREHENLRAVLLWSLTYGQEKQDMTIALRLGAALRNFWVIHGPFREGRVFLEQALAVREGVALPLLAKALFSAANLAFLQSDFDAAEAYCQESLKLFRKLQDRPGIAFALYLLAWVAKDDIAIDIALTEEALALFRELENSEFIAWSIYTLAYLDTLRGAYQSAFRLIEESLALHQALGNTRGIAYSLLTKAQLHLLSRSEQASVEACLDACLPLYQTLNDQDGLAAVGVMRGQLALWRKDIAQARALLEESLLLYKKMGSPQGILHSLQHLARIALTENNEMTAYNFYQEGLAIARKLDMKEWIATYLEGLANLAALQGKYSWATTAWGTAEALREAVHIPIPLIDQAEYRRYIALAHTHLKEDAFTTLWAKGRTMTTEQIITLQEQEIVLPVAPHTAPQVEVYPAGLTAREVQVLRLVAKGLTNSEIAQELGLSEKTIAHHMTHIFNKTTSDNRASVVAFAFRHGLA
jgi:predicted ATPase/DNA-binding CsgD family transcriptional regulator